MRLVKLNNRTYPGAFESLFNDLFAGLPPVLQDDQLHAPPVNIYEGTDGYHLEAIVPGLKKEELSVNVENGLLTIAWEKKEEKNTEGHKTLRREYRYRTFKRTFSVDDSVNTENIDAKYENGILKVFLPKTEPNKTTRQISIQ